jgi:hypothetical protein
MYAADCPKASPNSRNSRFHAAVASFALARRSDAEADSLSEPSPEHACTFRRRQVVRLAAWGFGCRPAIKDLPNAERLSERGADPLRASSIL